MTEAEAAKMTAVIVAAYPNFDKFKNPQEVRNYVRLLTTMFEADDGAAVGLAVKKHIATSKWPPSIAEIRELILETTHPEIVPPDLAWAAVSDLIFTMKRSQWDEVRDRLPALICRAVEIIGWKNLHDMHSDGTNLNAKPGMDRVAFMQQYTPMFERAKREAMTPAPVALKINGQQAALPDTSYRLIESAETSRRMKELEITEKRAEQKRQMDLAIQRDEAERKARLAEWKAKKERGELPQSSAAYVALQAMENAAGGAGHAKG